MRWPARGGSRGLARARPSRAPTSPSSSGRRTSAARTTVRRSCTSSSPEPTARLVLHGDQPLDREPAGLRARGRAPPGGLARPHERVRRLDEPNESPGVRAPRSRTTSSATLFCLRFESGTSTGCTSGATRGGKSALVTGSSGLIGSETVAMLDRQGWAVHGLDNNMRRDFFGADGDTTPNLHRLISPTQHFAHHALDIRDRDGVVRLIGEVRPCSDRARRRAAVARPRRAASVRRLRRERGRHAQSARGSARDCPESPFVFLSTNKVYGDAPNELELVELETR